MKSIQMPCLALIGNSRSILPVFQNRRPLVSAGTDFACIAVIVLFLVLFLICMLSHIYSFSCNIIHYEAY